MSKLSPYGKLIKACEDVKATVDSKFDWSDAICDAAILSAITFFATLSGTSIAGLTGSGLFIAGFIAAGTQFFTVLALKRGLVSK
jgi:hypothetical protein